MSAGQGAAAATPGQAAYEAYWANREPGIATARIIPAVWDDEQHARRAQWEAAAQGAIEADRRQALSIAMRALRTVAWGSNDGKPIDPSVVADKALVELRDTGVSLTGGDLAVTAAAAALGASGDDESLSGHVTVRFPADMAAWVKQFAAAEGMTVGAWIRREVEREARRREQPAPGDEWALARAAREALLSGHKPAISWNALSDADRRPWLAVVRTILAGQPAPVTVARLRAAVEARVSYADQHVIDCDAAELWEVIAEELEGK